MLDVLAGGGEAAVQFLRLCLHFLAVAAAFGQLVWQGAQAAVVGFGGGKRVLVGLILLLQGLQRGFGFGLLVLGKLVLLGALGEGVLQGGLLALMLRARGLHGGLVFVFQHEPGNQYAEKGGGQGGEQDLDVGVGHGIKNGRLKRRMWNG